MKRTLIIYNTKETTQEEAKHLLNILNCDDSMIWDNADRCGVEIIEVPTDSVEGTDETTEEEMRTPMQKLIIQMSYNRDRAIGAEKDAYNICILYAENMLEKEKEVIINTYNHAYEEGWDSNSWQPEQYYNETFNTKER